MKTIFLIVAALLTSYISNCQGNVDSLKKRLTISRSAVDKIDLLIKISSAYREADPQKSLEFAQKSVQTCTGRQPYKYYGKALMQLSICQLDVYDYKNSLHNIEKAIAIFAKTKEYKDLALALNTKGRISYLKSEYPKAIDCYNIALRTAKKYGDKNGMSLSHLNLGLAYATVSDVDKSFKHLKKSIEIDSLLKNKDGVSKGYNNLGVMYSQVGDFYNSLKCYTKAYNISFQLKNRSDMSKYLTNIGNIYYQTKEYPKALSNYLHSVNIKKQLSDKMGIANTYNNIGAVYAEKNMLDSTIFYFKTAIKIYESIKEKYNAAKAYANLGAVYKMRGNDQIGFNYICKSIAIRLEIGDSKGVASCYFKLGDLYYGKKDALALRYYTKAASCAEKIADNELMMKSFLKISSLYENRGANANALAYYKKYHAASDSIYSSDKQKEVLELQTKYEVAAKDNEIKMLSYNYEINRLNLERSKDMLKRQQLIIGGIAFVLLLFACFSIIYFRLFKQKQRVNLKLEEQNTEIEQQNKEIVSQKNHLEILNDELEIQKEKVMNQRDAIEAELKKTLLASEILQRENIQYKFDVLKNQLNPHFLFNTFSTLISLIPENPELAERYTRSLSKVYRYILNSKDKELVKLKDEVEFIGSYMFLISMRFDENVTIEISIDDEMLEYYLPLLSLQLLVENAVKHNVVTKRKPLLITIKNRGTSIIVQNNLQQKSSIVDSTKIGLQNIINRYQLICPEKVDIQQTATHFTVKLPLVKENGL